MREINEAQGGREFVFDPFGRFSNPAGGSVGSALRRFAPGGGPPKGGEGKFAKIFFDGGANGRGRGVDIKNLAAIGGISGARGNGVIDTRIHIEPPEELGAGKGRIGGAEGGPDFFGGDHVVGLFPEMNFGQLTVVPAVADDAVAARADACQIVGLRGAGHGWESREDVRANAAQKELGDARRGGPNQRFGQADDVDDSGSFHATMRAALSGAREKMKSGK